MKDNQLRKDLPLPEPVYAPLSEISVGTNFAQFFKTAFNLNSQNNLKDNSSNPTSNQKYEQQLEREMAKSFLAKTFRSRSLNGSLIYLTSEVEEELFDDILEKKSTNPFLSPFDAMRMFAQRSHSTALIKIIYNLQLDACLTYNHDQSTTKDALLRSRHLVNLVKSNLILVISISELNSSIRTIKIVASFESLIHEAGRISIKFPLSQEAMNRLLPHTKTILNSNFYSYFKYSYQSMKLSAVFNVERFNDFEKSQSEDIRLKFFSPAKRNELIYSIACRCADAVIVSDCDSISELIRLNIYNDFYCLHDIPDEEIYRDSSIRSDLNNWIRSFNIFKTIPVEKIRDYYGDDIAIYYAWIQFFIVWSIPLAIIGVLTFVYGIYNCSKNGWSLIALFDTSLTPFFGIALNLWSILFFKFWKRNNNYLKFLWNMVTENGNGSRSSLEVGIASKMTANEEKVELDSSSIMRKIVSNGGMLLSVILVLGLLALTIYWQILLQNSYLSQATGSAVTSAFMLIQILLFKSIGEKFALLITQYEHIRSSIMFDKCLKWRTFLLSFASNFGLLAFVGIFNPLVSAFSLETKTGILYFGKFELTCPILPNGDHTCFQEMIITVMIVSGAKQLLILVFQLTSWWSSLSYSSNNERREMPTLLNDIHSLDFIYSVIQFGEILFCSTPFVLNPALILFINAIQVRLTLSKNLNLRKRPFPTIFTGFSFLQSVISFNVQAGFFTNAFTLSFTANGINNLLIDTSMPIYFQLFSRICIVLFYQNIMQSIFAAVEFLVSDMPGDVIMGKIIENTLYDHDIDADLSSQLG